MTEKIIGKKNGMAVMLLTILFYLVAVAGAVLGGLMMDEGMVLGLILFVTSVGFIAGPKFFSNMKKNFKLFKI